MQAGRVDDTIHYNKNQKEWANSRHIPNKYYLSTIFLMCHTRRLFFFQQLIPLNATMD